MALAYDKFLRNSDLNSKEQHELVTLLSNDPLLEGIIDDIFIHQSINRETMSISSLGNGKHVLKIDKATVLVDSRFVDVDRLTNIIQ